MNATREPQALVRIRDLHFRRGDKSIFQGLDLEVPRGGITTILGPSGTGKTTLLKLIGGQLKPLSGTIEVDGLDVPTLRRAELYRLRKRLGMLFQSGALLTDLSVFDNVAFPLREHTELPESLIRHLVLMRLHAVGLRGARDLYPAELSGGMSRRVALARALVFDPMMIMYDEPFTGQDPISMGVLIELIRTVNEALGLTSLIVSHDLKEALSISDHAVIISGGRVVEAGSPAELNASSSDWVQQFLNGAPDGPVPFQIDAPHYADDLLGDGADALAASTRERLSPHSERGGAIPSESTATTDAASGSAAVSAPARSDAPREPSTSGLVSAIARLGRSGLDAVERFGRAQILLMQVLIGCRSLPRRFFLLVRQLYASGVLTLSIVLVSGLFVGMVLALQGYNTLVGFGAEESLGVVVALTLVRELGPVVTGLLFAGRAGSAMTAEIGLMKATEQLSGLEMMAVDPYERVFAPRFVAGFLALPALAAMFSAVGVIGGHLVGVELLGVDAGAYWSQMQAAVDFGEDVMNGMIKALVFGLVVTWIAIFEGSDCVPTSEGVSSATTRTVVYSSLAILGLDFLLTAVMFTV